MGNASSTGNDRRVGSSRHFLKTRRSLMRIRLRLDLSRPHTSDPMNKKKLLAIGLAAFLISGGISAYAYRNAILTLLDYARDGDADGDGMPTRYEQRFGLDPLADDRYEDLDADAKFNFDEFREGLYPNQADSDGDSLADGVDRAPLNGTALPMREIFDSGLLWAHIPLDITRLECRSHAATRVPILYTGDLGVWEDHKGCIESPIATGNHAAALHPVTNTPWHYRDIDLEGHRMGAIGAPKKYADKDGLVHYEVEYSGIRERYGAEIANNQPTPLADESGVAYRFTTFDINVPANPPEHVTFELQGHSGDDNPLAFDVRFYHDRNYEPEAYEDRTVAMAQRYHGGSYQVDIPLPASLTPGPHVLFVMPFLVDAAIKDVSAPTDFAIHNVNQRILEAIVLNATNDSTPLLDGVPTNALGITATSSESLATHLGSTEIPFERWNQAATLVESFAAIGVIPDASVHGTVTLGSPESARLAGAKGVVVTHEAGGKYHVTTRSAALVNDERGVHLVTRSSTESFTRLPPRYAAYAEKGIIESSAHAVAVATEIGADAQAVTRKAEAETVEAGLEKLRAGFGGTHTALDELNPKAVFAKTAFRVAGSGLFILDLITMDRHWDEAMHAAGPIEAAKAWGLFIATGVSAATIVLPFSPFVAAIAAIIAIAAEALLDPAFYAQVIGKATGAIQAVGGRIPDSDQRALFARATREFEPIARAANAPLFVGQVDVEGNGVTPAAFALPQGKVGMFPQLLVIGLIGLAVAAMLSGRR